MLNGTENIRPLRDRVLVKELPWRNQTASGLHLPDQAQKGEHVWRALVVAVGPGKPALGIVRELSELTFLDDREAALDLAAEAREALQRGFGIDGVKPGDVVLVSKYGGADVRSSKIRYGEESLDVIAATDILCVIEGEANALRRALDKALAKLDAWELFADTEPPPAPEEDNPPLEIVGTQ